MQVAAGLHHTLAASADGDIYAWGANECGQLGTGCTAGCDTPQLLAAQVLELEHVVEVACGSRCDPRCIHGIKAQSTAGPKKKAKFGAGATLLPSAASGGCWGALAFQVSGHVVAYQSRLGNSATVRSSGNIHSVLQSSDRCQLRLFTAQGMTCVGTQLFACGTGVPHCAATMQCNVCMRLSLLAGTQWA